MFNHPHAMLDAQNNNRRRVLILRQAKLHNQPLKEERVGCGREFQFSSE